LNQQPIRKLTTYCSHLTILIKVPTTKAKSPGNNYGTNHYQYDSTSSRSPREP
jgi:hypothetical protein